MRRRDQPLRRSVLYRSLGLLSIQKNCLVMKYVKRNIAGRLSSRHFRNQLRLMREDDSYEDFLNYALPWLDGMEIESFGQHQGREEPILDVYYREVGSRVPKELVWAGDGIQVWLQILYHVYRVRKFETIILDEPEVYLHPDLQRKLVHLLEETGKQIILATHSSEVTAEANPGLVTLVDRSRRRARRAGNELDLQLLSSALGSRPGSTRKSPGWNGFRSRRCRADRGRGHLGVGRAGGADAGSLCKRVSRRQRRYSISLVLCGLSPGVRPRRGRCARGRSR